MHVVHARPMLVSCADHAINGYLIFDESYTKKTRHLLVRPLDKVGQLKATLDTSFLKWNLAFRSNIKFLLFGSYFFNIVFIKYDMLTGVRVVFIQERWIPCTTTNPGYTEPRYA